MSGALTDLQTATIIGSLDLVITVDTAVAHLAGAVGRPVWVLLPRVPDWRWMLGRDDTPWYRTMRLFRQAESGCWEMPVTAIASALQAEAGKLNDAETEGRDGRNARRILRDLQAAAGLGEKAGIRCPPF